MHKKSLPYLTFRVQLEQVETANMTTHYYQFS